MLMLLFKNFPYIFNRRRRRLSRTSDQPPPDVLYKYIVVGGGTGGCITAYILAKNLPQGRVLLVDGGKDYTNGPNPKMQYWFENWAKYSRIYETRCNSYNPAQGSSHIGIGGCGAHDTRITFMPTKQKSRRYDQLMGWSKGTLDKYIKMALEMMPLNSSPGGEVFYDVMLDTLKTTNTLKGLPNNEYKAKHIVNSAGYVSIAMYPDETRWTSALLVDSKTRPFNLDVVTNYSVDKVLFCRHTNKAIGIKGCDTSRNYYVENEGEIILTSGSIGTPAILQRSGIGPRKLLEKLDIDVLYDNNEVGHGVDHLEVPVQYELLSETELCKNETELLNTYNGVPRGGPMGWPIVMFMDKDVMAHVGISPPPYGGNEVTITPNCVNPDPEAGFRVEIQSLKNHDIQLVHLDSPKDFKTLLKGVYRTIDIFEVLKEHSIVGKRVQPDDESLKTDESLDKWIRDNVGTAYHWMSTCKAGVKGSVADEHFRVRGVKGLRVGSGACLPEIPEANPHLTISAFSIALACDILGITSVSEIKD